MPYIIAMNIVKFSSVYQEWLHVLFENLTSNQGFDVETAPGGGAVSISDIHYDGDSTKKEEHPKNDFAFFHLRRFLSLCFFDDILSERMPISMLKNTVRSLFRAF